MESRNTAKFRIMEYDFMLLHLFVLRIGKEKDAKYQFVYGIITPSVSVSDKPSVSDFNQIKPRIGATALFLCEIKFSTETDVIHSIYEELLSGVSLRKAFEDWDVDTTGMPFDVSYPKNHVLVPWAEERLARNELNYVRKVCLPEKEILRDTDSLNVDDRQRLYDVLVDKVSAKLNITSQEMGGKIGNIDIIVTPARNVQGQKLVVFLYQKGKRTENKPFVQEIKVLEQLAGKFRSIAVNARVQVGGKILQDLLEVQEVEKDKECAFRFESAEPIETTEIKVWGQTEGASTLLYAASFHYTCSIGVNIHVVEKQLQITTDWLEKIRANANVKQQAQVDEASKIKRKSLEKMTIEDKSYPKWSKRNSSERFVRKSNDEFFPKGWDEISNENGRLCFLDWFKRKSEEATSVFLQDPYFESIALDFLASANTNCEYTILTQTQLKTNSDGTDSFVPKGEISPRRELIVNQILKNPILFRNMKLVIQDIAAADNKLHDRYVFFFYPERTEAYTLSNSIQGATTKQPLLITEIGDRAFALLKKHIDGVLADNTIETIYDYRENKKLPSQEISEIADAGFYEWVESIGREPLNGDVIRRILDDAIRWNTNAKISTLGYCLAHEQDSVVDIVAESIRNNRAWIDTLKNFVLRIHYSAFPIGFIGCPYRESFYRSPSVLLESGFKEIVSRENLWFIEYVGMESGIYKVWGQYYACKILMMVAPEEAIDVLKQLRVTLCKVKYNKNTTPVFMITNMLLNEILLQTAYCSNISIMNMLLSDNEESFRALGVLMLIYHSKYCNEIDMEDGLGKIRDSNELIHTCEMALEIQLDDARKDVYCTKLLAAYQDSSSGSKVLEYFKKIITIQSRNSRKSAGEEYRVFSEEYKLLYVERIITPLISAGFVTKEAVKNIVIEVLFLHIGEPLTQYNGSWAQLLLSTGCNLSECYDRMRLFLDKFVESVSKMDLKNDDTIYRESFPLQKLKGLSMDILRIYGDATPYCISDLLKEINNLLEKYEIS